MGTAGISIGASVPALRRLVARKMVVAGKEGQRGRKDYKLTKAGKRAVEEFADAPPDRAPADFESLSRQVAVLWAMGHQKLALDMLADFRPNAAVGDEPDKAALDPQADPAQFHRWIFQQRTRFRAEADFKAAQSVLRSLMRIASPARKRRRSVPKGL
jgi:DNA-binding PadR family transcriptional regulator